MRRALPTAAILVTFVAGAAGFVPSALTAHTGEQHRTPAPAQQFRVGAVCAFDFGFSTEVSCGLVGFGDVRHHCPGATDAAMCPSTRGLTLKNTGSVPIQLIAVSGSRPGDRQEAAPRTVRVGADTVVRPRAGDAFLYDIVLRCNGGHAKAAVVAMA